MLEIILLRSTAIKLMSLSLNLFNIRSTYIYLRTEKKPIHHAPDTHIRWVARICGKTEKVKVIKRKHSPPARYHLMGGDLFFFCVFPLRAVATRCPVNHVVVVSMWSSVVCRANEYGWTEKNWRDCEHTSYANIKVRLMVAIYCYSCILIFHNVSSSACREDGISFIDVRRRRLQRQQNSPPSPAISSLQAPAQHWPPPPQ